MGCTYRLGSQLWLMKRATLPSSRAHSTNLHRTTRPAQGLSCLLPHTVLSALYLGMETTRTADFHAWVVPLQAHM
jgi:hypothetical protein